MKTIFRGYTKNRSSWSLREKICRQKLRKKLFGQVWRNSGKILRTPKICLLLHLWSKGISASIVPLWKGQMRLCLWHVSILRRPCAYYSTRTRFTRCCELQCVTAKNINFQRFPKSEQFVTAKISGNTLKQGCRTHSMLRQRSSQLQKYKAVRMSRWIAVDEKVYGWDDGHPGLTVWNLLNYTRIENVHEVCKKFSFSVMWLLYVQLLRGEKIRACVGRYDPSAWNAN